MYMNKTKRNLIIAGAIVNIIVGIINLVMSILIKVNQGQFKGYEDYHFIVSLSTTNLVMTVISSAVGLVASILLLYSVRQKGKYFRQSQGMFYTGFIIVIFFGGGWLSWLLLFISAFVPDVIVMNTKSEVKKEEVLETKEMEEKKKRIDDLKRLRDAGIISEEEYKEKLFELL